MKPAFYKSTARTVAILLAFAVVGTALLAFTFNLTHGIIAHNEKQARLTLIGQVLPADLYDNNILKHSITLPPSDLLGSNQPTPAYRARLHGRITAVVLEANAPDGYGGNIKLLVAIRSSGEIAGVRVLSQHETPGLGDYIDSAHSDWIKVFNGTSLKRYTPRDWRVKKDGGKFDYMAGATVSPRAVVKAVHKALEYFRQDRGRLLGPARPGPVQGAKSR